MKQSLVFKLFLISKSILSKILFLFISSLFLILNIEAQEENILFSTKGKSPIYSKIKYDKYGNRKSISFVKTDENSEHLVEMDGLAIAKIKYDTKSKTFKVKEYDIDRNLLFTNKVKIQKDKIELITFLGKKKNGKALFKKTVYNLDGNKTQEEFLDENNKPNTNKNKITKILYKYSQNGKLISLENFDSQGKYKEDANGIAKYIYTYDARGNKLTSSFFGENEKPKEGKDGFASESFTYDYTTSERGKLVLHETFDKKGQPKENKKGIAKTLNTYDKKGNKIATEFRDANGKLKEDGKGFAKYIYEYAENGNLILEEQYGSDGKLKLDPADGIAKITSEFITNGDTVTKTTQFFDAEKKLKISEVLEAAIVKVSTKLTKDGKEIKTEYFDTEGKPKLGGEGYAILFQKYDLYGNQILEEYFDGNNKPVLSKDGYSRYTASFKEKEMLSEEYWNLEGKLIEGDDGFAKQVRTFLPNGKIQSVENFDSANQFIESNLGYAKLIYSYNADGNKSEELFLNTKLQPTNNSEGISKITYQYNKECLTKTKKEEDCQTLVQHFDSKGKPVANKKQIFKTITSFDEQGRIKSIQNYGADESIHSRHIYSYELGNKREIAWEIYKKGIITRAIYNYFILQPELSPRPVVKITLNKLCRPVGVKLVK